MDNTWFEKMEERIPRGEVRTRFAPSPTGYMHVGNLRTALYTWCIARHAHGKFLLRIEDTDQSRQVEGAVEVIYKTLRDCGLDHDEGPDVGGPVGPYVQTERRDTYLPYAKRLVERGHAYYCFCDKTESEEDSGDFTRKDDPCRDLSAEEVQRRLDAGMPWVIRQKIPHEGETTFHDEIFGDITAPNADLDDQVLIKRDGLPTYNFANVIDDHLMGITHVVRGSEYLSSAPKYNLLYEAFGWTPPKYVHLTPVMANAQRKLSKRKGDPSFEDLLNQGAVALCIDLRGNPGGLDTECAKFLDYLLPNGTLFIETDKQGNEKVTTSDGMCIQLPMCVLVNAETFGEAEVCAAVLQEYQWATVLGEATTGKTRTQETIPLEDGSALRLSTGTYLTGNRTDISAKGGVVPDLILYNSDASATGTTDGTVGESTGVGASSNDEQLMQALKLLS